MVLHKANAGDLDTIDCGRPSPRGVLLTRQQLRYYAEQGHYVCLACWLASEPEEEASRHQSPT